MGMDGHMSLLMVMVWVWVQIQRKMLGFGVVLPTITLHSVALWMLSHGHTDSIIHSILKTMVIVM